MQSLEKYLEKVIASCYCPITFSGDKHSIINRWLIKGQPMEENLELDSAPYFKNKSIISLDPDYNFLPKEVLDSNWRFYFSEERTELFQQNRPEEILSCAEDMYIYGLCNIHCLKQRDVYLYINAETPLRAWTNGNLVSANSYGYFIKPYPVICRLNEGNNTLLVEKRVLSQYRHIRNQSFQIVAIPCEALQDEDNCYFREDMLFEDMEKAYHIVAERAVNGLEQDIKAIVFPQFFKNYAKERIRVSFFDTKGEEIYSTEAFTSETITFHVQESKAEGVLKIRADSLQDTGKTADLHVFRGDFEQESKRLTAEIKERQDGSAEVINILKRMAEMPDVRRFCYKGLPEMLNERFYSTLFEKYAELYEYIGSPDASEEKGVFDVFRSDSLMFMESDIDDGFMAYGIYLPKGYDPKKGYALVVMGTYGYALSKYPLPVPYMRKHQYEDAVIMNICSLFEVENDLIYETDIIKAIKHVMELLSIDRERIYLLGVCSASKRCFRWTLKMPDLFAGYACVFGCIGRDPLNPTWEANAEQIISELREGKSDFLTPDSDYANNVQNMALYHLGDIEDLGENWVKDMSVLKNLKRYKGFYSHSFSHDLFDEMFCTRKLLNEIIKEKREAYPAKIEFTTYLRPYNKSHWIKIDAFEDVTKKATVNAQIIGTGIHINTENVAMLSMLIDRSKFENSRRLVLVVDGSPKEIEISAYSKALIKNSGDCIGIYVAQLTQEQFMKEYGDISIDEALTGTKQVYLSKCTIVKPDYYKSNKQSFARKLFYSIQNPLKNKMRIYNYDVVLESDIGQELNNNNFIHVMDMENVSEVQRGILSLAGITAGQGLLEYKGIRFQGDYFALVKCKNPFNDARWAVFVLMNGLSAEDEILKLYGTFDSNPVFLSDTVVYSNCRYHHFTGLV